MNKRIVYPCVARSAAGFISQIVKYVQSGHYFYVRCLVPERKSSEHIDQKILDLYDISRPRWRRERRNLKGSAGIHYLRYQNLFVILVSKGRHDDFYRDHGDAALDIRRTALKVFGYQIRHTYSRLEQRYRVFVRLDKEAEATLRSHLLTICTWETYREKLRIEREFQRLHWQPYGPVYQQLYRIWKRVNRRRKAAGMELLHVSCIPKFRRLDKVFGNDNGDGESLQMASVKPSDWRGSCQI